MRRRVQEGVPGQVRRPKQVGVDLVIEGASEGVGGEDVEPAVADERRADGHGVEGPLEAGAHRPRPGGAVPGAAQGARPVGGPGQVEKVGPLGLVELEGPGEGLEHPGRGAGQRAPLQLGVVLDAHPGQGRHLAAAQPGDPAGATGGQASLAGRDLGTAGLQEVADLLTVVHASRVKGAARLRGALRVHLPAGTSLSAWNLVPWVHDLAAPGGPADEHQT